MDDVLLLSSVARDPFFHPHMKADRYFPGYDQNYRMWELTRCWNITYVVPLDDATVYDRGFRRELRTTPADYDGVIMIDAENTTKDPRLGRARVVLWNLAHHSSESDIKQHLCNRLRRLVDMCRALRPRMKVTLYGSISTGRDQEGSRWEAAEAESVEMLYKHLDFVTPTVYPFDGALGDQDQDDAEHVRWRRRVERAIGLAKRLKLGCVPITRSRHTDTYRALTPERFGEICCWLLGLGADGINLWEQDYHSWYNARREGPQGRFADHYRAFSTEDAAPGAGREAEMKFLRHQIAFWWPRYMAMRKAELERHEDTEARRHEGEKADPGAADKSPTP